MIDDALATNRHIAIIQPTSDAERDKPSPRLAPIGCLGRITQFAETGDGRYLVVLSGTSRFRIQEEVAALTSYRQCSVDYSDFEADARPTEGEDRVDRAGLWLPFGIMPVRRDSTWTGRKSPLRPPPLWSTRSRRWTVRSSGETGIARGGRCIFAGRSADCDRAIRIGPGLSGAPLQ